MTSFKKKILLLSVLFSLGIVFFLMRTRKTEAEVRIETLQAGQANSLQVQVGDLITLNYKNTLEDGTPLDSTYESKIPFTFRFGDSQILRGWNKGLLGAKIGERRKIFTPYNLAYGETGAPPRIPPNANILSEVEILNILRAPN